MSRKHTDLPWSFMSTETWRKGGDNRFSSICHIGDYTIVTNTPSYEFHANVTADAEFICAAVNSHDDMLAALQNLVAQILDYERVNNLSPNPGRKYCWDATERAIAAISKATGE